MKILLRVVFWIFCCLSAGKSAGIVEISQNGKSHSLSSYFDICVDSTEGMSFLEISDPSNAIRFHPLNSVARRLGYSRYPLWIRCRMANASDEQIIQLIEFEYAALDTVEIFFPDGKGAFQRKLNGTLVPAKQRYVNFHTPVFPIPFAEHSETEIYFRVHTASSMIVNASIKSAHEYSEETGESLIYFGIYFGIFLALIMYHLSLFVTVRYIGYLYYSCHIFGYFLYQLVFYGFAQQLIFIDNVWFIGHFITFAVAWIFIFGSLVAQELLDTRRYHPAIHLTLSIIAGCAMCFPLLIFTGDRVIEYKLISIVGLIFPVLWIVVAGATLRQRYIPGYFFFIGICIVFIGFITRASRNIGFLPPTSLFTNGLMYANIFEAIFFAIGFGLRIKLTEDERVKEKELLRNKIASDLHDDVSATLSSIDFYSEALIKLNSIKGKKGQYLLQMISQSAREAKERITDIVWSINSNDDTWRSLLSKSRRFIEEMFDAKGIEYHVQIPKIIDIPLTIEHKHHVWLIMKELVINICRHSEAVHANVELQYHNKTLYLYIRDDGKGFEM
ncbi:MAG: histidine kinase, partial [Bacteroidetes bacterium]|nr:histidine kinase [Bacteroidota bacterium]